MPDIHAVAACFYKTDTRSVLLGRRGPTKTHPGTWCNPGGGIEPGDVTYFDALKRELYEETGIPLTKDIPPRFSMMHLIPFGGRIDGHIAVFYYFDFPLPSEAVRPDGREITALEWISLDRNQERVPLQPGTAIQLAHLRAVLEHDQGFRHV